MRTLSLVALVALAASPCAGADLPRSTPEAQGVSSAAVLAFVQAADKDIDSLHSVMLVRHGHVVAEGWWAPYAAGSPHMRRTRGICSRMKAAGCTARTIERGRPPYKMS